MKLDIWCSEVRGRQAALAARLGVKPPTVADWVSRKKPIPLDKCPGIQEFTGGAVTCEELRPDMVEFFALVRQQSASHEQKQPPALANAA